MLAHVLVLSDRRSLVGIIPILHYFLPLFQQGAVAVVSRLHVHFLFSLSCQSVSTRPPFNF